MPKPEISRRNLLRSAGAVGAVATVAAATGAGAEGLLGGGSVEQTVTEALQLVRVWAKPGHEQVLAALDETHVRYADGSQQFLLWPGDLAKLTKSGLRFEVEVADVRLRDLLLHKKAGSRPAALAAQPGERSDYRVYDDFVADMKALAAKYPTKARLLELPHKTLQQRTVYGLEIATNVSHQDGRPVFYNDGCHHAREWPSAEMPIMWAYDLLENYGKDPRITALVDHTRNIIVPVVNVDGYVYSRAFPIETGTPLTGDGLEGGLLGGQGAYVRKNRRPLLSTDIGDGTALAVPKPMLPLVDDSIGVDVNRNYPYSWGDDLAGSSSSMLDQTYRGTDPGSEQETRNVISILHGNHVLGLITHHTSGDLVLWPWGDTFADAPDNAFLEGVGRAMATYNGYEPKKNIQLYVTTGTTVDYHYGTTGGMSYTFEHAGVAFHPPYAETVPAMYARNREAFIMLASLSCLAPEQRPTQKFTPAAKAELAKKKVSGALTHGIITGRTVNKAGKPVVGTLSLTKVFETILWKGGDGNNPLGQRMLTERVETSLVTQGDGAFEWHVNPSTRPILAAAGKTETYLLSVTGPKGTGISKKLVVKRGQRIKLGDIVVD